MIIQKIYILCVLIHIHHGLTMDMTKVMQKFCAARKYYYYTYYISDIKQEIGGLGFEFIN